MSNPKTAIVIPAFNESTNIYSVIDSVKDYANIILVVNDGSTDKTVENAIKAGAKVLSNSTNRGYDYSIMLGLSYCFNEGYDIIVSMDADGQHKTKDVKAVIDQLRSGSSLVVGKRESYQRFGEKIFGYFCNWKFGIPDPFCGLKGYKNIGIATADMLVRKRFDSVGTRMMFLYLISGISPCKIDIVSPPRVDESRFGRGFFIEMRLLKTIFGSICCYFHLPKK